MAQLLNQAQPREDSGLSVNFHEICSVTIWLTKTYDDMNVVLGMEKDFIDLFLF